jgi:hypothetical protein
MKPVTSLVVGDIMQLSPEPNVCKNPMFAGCMFVVTEPKSFGAQGYVQGLGENGAQIGQAYYRASWEEMEFTGGRAVWIAQ